MIDRTLVAKFVAAKGADPLAEDVENLIQFIRKGIESGGDTVEAVLGKLKLTEADLRQAAQLSVSWEAYLGRTIKEQELRDYFESHREQFDGTKIRAVASPKNIAGSERLARDIAHTEGEIAF